MPIVLLVIVIVMIGHLLMALLPWLAAASAVYLSVCGFMWLRRRQLAARAVDAERVQARMMTSGQMRRAQKCVALLGSSHDGERLAALAALDRILASENVTYNDLAYLMSRDLSIR